MLRALARWWACNVRFPSRQRGLFYDILATQLGSGIAVGEACATVAEVGVSAQMARVARAAADAEAEGRGAVEGLADSGCLPVTDVRLLRVAERSASLGEALRDLRSAQAGRLGVLATVIVPNTYPLAMLAVALVGGSLVADFVATAVGEEEMAGNRAVELSRAIKEYGPPVAFVAAGMLALGAVGLTRWRGPHRRLLGVFDGVYRTQVGIAFAGLAARLTERGAGDVEVLDAAEEAFGRRGYTGSGIALVRRDVEGGVAMENALAERLLTSEYAAVLKALVPRGERELYPRGYRAVADVQTSVLRGQLNAAAGTLRMVALGGAAVLIMVMVPGIYGLFGSLMSF